MTKAFRRYIVIGGSVYIFELLVILVTGKLGAKPVTSVAYSFGFGLLLSFVLQKFLTFGDARLHHRVLLPQMAAFSLLVLFNFGFTILVAQILKNILPAVVTRTIALGATTIWNFYLYRTRIFKADSNPVY